MDALTCNTTPTTDADAAADCAQSGGDDPPPARRRTVAELEAATPPESMIRYRVVASMLQACMDLFSAMLTELPKGERFTAPEGRGETAADRVRNDMRTYALGCFAALGREVGLSSVELYGEGKGRTLLTVLLHQPGAT